MKKVSLKTFIPAILLILVLFALSFVTVYALTLKKRVSRPVADVLPVTPPMDNAGILRTAVPETPSPAPTFAPVLAETDETDDETSEVGQPYWSDGILFVNDTYRSPTMSVTVTTTADSEMFDRQMVYYVADIHVSDVTQLRTACASDNFANARSGSVLKMARRENALVAISGDYCSARGATLIIRNGEVYSKAIGKGDVCLLLRNGEMETILNSQASIKKILNKDPWQAWEFGPALLDSDGKAYRSFSENNVGGRNPRCAIGYFEPGHYCFVVVDGRQKDYSYGLFLRELALLMESLGCKQAYNLDGGNSAQFFWKDSIFNQPSGGGRVMADIIYVAYEPYSESRFYCGKAGLSE